MKSGGKSIFCRHALDWTKCVVCGDGIVGYVYITGGGTHFHTTPDCTALVQGQEKVRRRGGNQEPIEAAHTMSGVVDRRVPCRACAQRHPRSDPSRTKRSASARQSAGPASSLERMKLDARRQGLTLQEVASGGKRSRRR